MAGRIPSLDGLRALSIALVFAGHLAGTRHFISSDVMVHFGDLGNLGVRTFFVISGFLITHLLLRERARAHRISLKAFYVRRVLRIFPAFYVFVAVVAVLTAVGFVANDRRDFVHALTYTMNYEGLSDHFTLRHLWSLAVEEQFYFVWPLTLALLGVGRATYALAAVILFVPLLRVGLYHLVPSYEVYVMTAFESVCDALASGALLAIVLPRLKKRAWFVAMISSSAFPAVFAVVLLVNLQTDHPHFFWMAGIPAMNVAIALIVARYVEFPDLLFARILNSRALVAVGTISYSLYLWQQLFLIQSRPTPFLVQQFPFNLAATFVCGALSYKLIEQPFLRLKHRFEPAASARPHDVRVRTDVVVSPVMRRVGPESPSAI